MWQTLQEQMIAAAGLVMASIAGALATWIKRSDIGRWFKKRRANKIDRRLAAVYRADRALQNGARDSVLQFGADRGVVFKAHNCGEAIAVGSPKFTTATFAFAYNPQDESQNPYEHGQDLVEEYQQIPLHGDYIDMLMLMLEKGFYHFRTKDHEGTQLYHYYSKEGVTDSYVFLAWSTPHTVCYWSVATFREGGFTPTEIRNMKYRAEKIRPLCQDAHA